MYIRLKRAHGNKTTFHHHSAFFPAHFCDVMLTFTGTLPHVPCPPTHTCNTSDNQNAGSYRPRHCHRAVFHATKLACEQATNTVHAKGHSNSDAQRVCCAVSCNLFHTRTKSPFKRLINYDLQHKALFSHSLDSCNVL